MPKGLGNDFLTADAYVGVMLVIILSVLLSLSLLALLGVLATGIFTFARGGAFNDKYGHRLMNLRVATQAVAVVLLGLLVLVRGMKW